MRLPIRDLFITLGVFAAFCRNGPAVVRSCPWPGRPRREGAGEPPAVTPGDSAGIAAALNEAMANVVERTLPGVVSVHIDRQRVIEETVVTGVGPRVGKRTVREPGVGSGVIVSKEGLVMTNWHVVEGEDVLIRVTLHGDEEPRRATLVDKDESVDIALLKIEPRQAGEQFPWMVFGDSDLMRPGHFVFALGNPLNLAETVTQGIISNRPRGSAIPWIPTADRLRHQSGQFRRTAGEFERRTDRHQYAVGDRAAGIAVGAGVWPGDSGQ